MESNPVGTVRSRNAPVIGGILALVAALGLCAGLVALGQKVFPSGDPRGPRLFKQYLPISLGGAATFYAFQRVPVNITLRDLSIGSSARIEGDKARVVVSPLGGTLLVGIVVAIGGYITWRMRGRREDPLIRPAAAMALTIAIGSLVLSFVMSVWPTKLERGSFSNGVTRVTYEPSHVGAFVWPLVFGFVFGILGMHIAKHGRGWRRALIDDVAARSDELAKALRAALSGLAVGGALVVLAGLATAGVAIVQHPAGAGEVLGSGKNIAGLAEGAILGVPHATAAGLVGSMGVPARFVTEIGGERGGTAGSAGIFGVRSSHEFGSRAVAVPSYALGGLGIAAVFTFLTGSRAAALAEGDRRRSIRIAMAAAVIQTIVLWGLAYLVGASGRLATGTPPSVATARIGPSLLAVVVLPILWTLGGGLIGSFVGSRRGVEAARAEPVRGFFRGRLVLGTAIVALIAVGSGVVARRALVDEHPSISAGSAGKKIYTDPDDAWTLEFPASWHAQPILERHRGGVYTGVHNGIIVSNVDRRFEHAAQTEGFSFAWDMSGLPPKAVVLMVTFTYLGGFTVHCDNTPLPLSLANAHRSVTKNGAGGTEQTLLRLPFVAQHVPYYGLTAWMGSEAPERDTAALEEIVRSISFENSPPGDPPQSRDLCPR